MAGGRRGSPVPPLMRWTRCAASRPRPPPADSVLCRWVSEFAGISANRSRRGWVARRWSLQASGSLPPLRGASQVALGPGEGGVRGFGGPRWASRLRRSGCALRTRNGRGRGQLWGVLAPLFWLAGGLCVGRSEGLGSPFCVCLSPRARRSSNKFCISAINFSHYICTNQRSPSFGPGAGLALKVVLGADCRGPRHELALRLLRGPPHRLASGSGASALRALPGLPEHRDGEGAGGEWRELGFVHPPSHSPQFPTPHPQLKRDLRGGQGAGRWAVSGAGRSDNGVARQSSWTRRGKSQLSVDCSSALERTLGSPLLSAYLWRPS